MPTSAALTSLFIRLCCIDYLSWTDPFETGSWLDVPWCCYGFTIAWLWIRGVKTCQEELHQQIWRSDSRWETVGPEIILISADNRKATWPWENNIIAFEQVLSSKNSTAKCFDHTHLDQCITVRQWTARYPFVHYSALFLYTFFVFHCDNLYFVDAALSSCWPFFILHHFHAALFLGSNLFMLRSFYVFHNFMLHFYSLQCFRFAFFSCFTLWLLNFFPVVLCS